MTLFVCLFSLQVDSVKLTKTRKGNKRRRSRRRRRRNAKRRNRDRRRKRGGVTEQNTGRRIKTTGRGNIENPVRTGVFITKK